MTQADEPERIRQRYARRDGVVATDRYDPLRPDVYMRHQERERALIRCIHYAGLVPVSKYRVLEVGCGTGANILQLVHLGFSPDRLVGVELLPERVAVARDRVPASTAVLEGDALTVPLPSTAFDVVLQSTVFSSILDDDYQRRLAHRMWSCVRGGGGVLWYDFIYDNPANPDVRGIPIHRLYQLFPEGKIKAWRLTLAPPIARQVTRVHASLYSVCNLLPPLRTHILCWVQKTG